MRVRLCVRGVHECVRRRRTEILEHDEEAGGLADGEADAEAEGEEVEDDLQAGLNAEPGEVGAARLHVVEKAGDLHGQPAAVLGASLDLAGEGERITCTCVPAIGEGEYKWQWWRLAIHE